MKLSFLSSWRGYKEGRSYDVPTGAALIYIRRGIAVEIEGEAESIAPPSPTKSQMVPNQPASSKHRQKPGRKRSGGR